MYLHCIAGPEIGPCVLGTYVDTPTPVTQVVSIHEVHRICVLFIELTRLVGSICQVSTLL